MLDITVKTMDSQSRNFTVPEEITVLEFKERIAPLVHIVRNKQRLIYQGRVLQDDTKLKDYEVHGKVIHLVERSPPQAQPRSQGPASTGNASSGNQPNADLSSGRYMMMGAINVQPPNVQQLQQVLQQAAAEMGRNAHITSNTGVDGSLEIQVNFGTHPLMATGEARLCLVTTQRLLQDLLDVVRRLEGGASVEAPMADADGEAGQSAENAPGEPSEASESTMGIGEQGPQAEQTAGSDGTTSQESTAPPARPTELLQLLADVQDARSRLDPHLQRYQSLLGTAASADYNNNTEGREGDQRTLNLVADAFSILGRIFVNLSRLRCNLDSSAPRTLFVPPGSVEQSPALVLPPGLLMQVGGAISGAAAAAAAGGRPTEGQAGGPATQSTPGSSAETGEGPQAATDGSAGQGQASGPPRFVQIRHRLDPIVMMRYFPGMNGNFAATSTTQTPTTQNAGGNIPPNVSFVYTTDASGSGQSGTSQASTTTAAPMASSGPGGATLFQVPPPELMPGLIQISQQISQHALDASNGQARFTFQIPHRVMLSPQLAPTRGMAPFGEQRAATPQGADGAENLARMIGRMMGQLVGNPAAPAAQQAPNVAAAPGQTSTPNAQPIPGSSSAPAQTPASNNGQQTTSRQGPSSQTSQTPPSQTRQIDQTLLMQLVMQGAAWGLGVAARAIGGVVTGPRDDVGGVEGGAAAVGDFLRNYAELIVDTGVMGTASAAGRQGTPIAETRATAENATPQETGNAGTARVPANGTGNVRLPGVAQTGQAFEEILSPEFMSMVVQAVLSTVLSSLGGAGAGSGAGNRTGAGSSERTTEPRQVPGGPGGRMAQENIASFIQRLSGASIVEAGAGFFSELLAVVCEGLSMADVVVLLHGSPGPLCHLRQNLVTFARERLLEGREPTDQNILEATDRLVEGMARYIGESFEGVAIREGVDIERANREFLRENVNQLASHVLQSTENDQAFSQRLLDLCTRMLLEWLTLNRLCLRDGVSGVVSLINDHIQRHLSAEVNPALVTWLTTMMESRIRSVMASMPTASEDVAVYMRHAPQAEGSEEAAVTQKESEMEEVDTEETDGEGNLQSPPPATTAEEVAGRANPPSIMDTDMEGTGAADMPGVAMGGEASGNGVVAAPGAEAWSSVVPPEWVPVIRQDLQCQRRLKPQAPLSDAYISGMPAKRRKTMQESEVTGCLSLSDALRRAARGAGVQPLTSLESLSADADNATLQQAYRQQVKSDIKKRLREDSEYDPARFPNSRQLFDKP
uniref:BCL2-associated athanogene 6 n=1 Tax=Eptatretus burgeri TaxID=7764 RepID=A0A8C4R4X2_EPTBU